MRRNKGMQTFTLTVFDPTGQKLLDESFTAPNSAEAKKTSELRLMEDNYHNHTHRCVTSDGKLILFHK